MEILRAKLRMRDFAKKCSSSLGSNEGYSLWISRHSKSEQGINPRERQRGHQEKRKDISMT